MTAGFDFYHYGDSYINHDQHTIATAGTDVEYDFINSGVDTVSKRYFDFGRPASKINIVPNQIITLTKINGIELKVPMTIGVAGFTFTKGYRFRNITLHTEVATTTISVLVV